MEINKQMMTIETRKFLKTIFSLPEIEKVAIKDIVIESLEDKVHIEEGLEKCFHDKFSDVDFNLWVKLSREDFEEQTPIYKRYFPRLGLKDKIFGVVFQERMKGETCKEGLRICLKSGFRMDVTCFTRYDERVLTLPQSDLREHIVLKQEKDFWEDWDLDKINEFWFISIQALGKLMRKDYLIADHLAYMLLMEGIVVQMVMRDNQYGTNVHRYGYGEELAYLNVDMKGAEVFKTKNDKVYNAIVEHLYAAVVSYDQLVQKVNPLYMSRKDVFFEIWRTYIKKS